jgi:hypothetical protein
MKETTVLKERPMTIQLKSEIEDATSQERVKVP